MRDVMIAAQKLRRALRSALTERLGAAVSMFRVLEERDGDRLWLAYRFVMYDYWTVIFTYDRGIFGFGIDHGSHSVGLLGSEELRPGLIDDLPEVVRILDDRVRLRIPDKYLDWWTTRSS